MELIDPSILRNIELSFKDVLDGLVNSFDLTGSSKMMCDGEAFIYSSLFAKLCDLFVIEF